MRELAETSCGWLTPAIRSLEGPHTSLVAPTVPTDMLVQLKHHDPLGDCRAGRETDRETVLRRRNHLAADFSAAVPPRVEIDVG